MWLRIAPVLLALFFAAGYAWLRNTRGPEDVAALIAIVYLVAVLCLPVRREVAR